MKHKYYIFLGIGMLGQGLSLSQMIKYNSQTSFKTPFFTLNKKNYKKTFEKNKQTLRKYQNVMYYDNFFALSYLITYQSLFYILIKDLSKFQLVSLYKIIIPLQSILDWIENSILYSQIEYFLENKDIKNQFIFVVVSSFKWILAVGNFGLYVIAIIKLVSKLIENTKPALSENIQI